MASRLSRRLGQLAASIAVLLSCGCAGQVTGTLGRQLDHTELRGEQVVYRIITGGSRGSTEIELQSDGNRHRILVSAREWGTGWFGLWGDTFGSREVNAACWSMIESAVHQAGLWSAPSLSRPESEATRMDLYRHAFPTTVEALRGPTYRRFEFEPLLFEDDDAPHSGDRFVEDIRHIVDGIDGPCRDANG